MSDTATATLPRLKARYDEEIRSQLKQELELGNVMQVPRLSKMKRWRITDVLERAK